MHTPGIPNHPFEKITPKPHPNSVNLVSPQLTQERYPQLTKTNLAPFLAREDYLTQARNQPHYPLEES
ncbi:hypothetical protein [Laspinema olomoucense]|uniref:hypothetical protein n=1 Tax=Laspinema olomoucense TaxID=3231600 RepID=UPI0021BB8E03|nr:hypothetical protein [Laspinema sp. D3b]